MSTAADRLELLVTARRALCPDILEFELARADRTLLPGFTPGAHITVQTPGGAMRRYSLVNDGTAPASYVIAVKREPGSRGGSVSMHHAALEDVILDVEPPKNAFELAAAPAYLLIAGGIGITPILAMARHLDVQRRPYRLIYCSRSAEEAAYLPEVTSLAGDIVVHHDGGERERLYDFWEELEPIGPQHVYCCGPPGLMEEVKAVSGHWPEGRMHFEDFKPVEVTRAEDVAFNVTLASSGRTVHVPADRSILEALRDAGERTVSSCESGSCGSCKCTLVAGEPDHRDMVLMEEERASRIMICVSRAKVGDLVVDL